MSALFTPEQVKAILDRVKDLATTLPKMAEEFYRVIRNTEELDDQMRSIVREIANDDVYREWIMKNTDEARRALATGYANFPSILSSIWLAGVVMGIQSSTKTETTNKQFLN